MIPNPVNVLALLQLSVPHGDGQLPIVAVREHAISIEEMETPQEVNQSIDLVVSPMPWLLLEDQPNGLLLEHVQECLPNQPFDFHELCMCDLELLVDVKIAIVVHELHGLLLRFVSCLGDYVIV